MDLDDFIENIKDYYDDIEKNGENSYSENYDGTLPQTTYIDASNRVEDVGDGSTDEEPGFMQKLGLLAGTV